MKTIVCSVIALGVGATAGYLIGTKLSKKKYYALADKEVASVKKSLEAYYNSDNKILDKSHHNMPEKKDNKFMKNDSIDYSKLEQSNNAQKSYDKYAGLYKPNSNEKEEKPVESSTDENGIPKPYVITPEEFADSDWAVKTLNYYSDGVLADDEYNVIKDIKGYIGDEALKSFGVYEEDAVYVRNEKYKIDYEILYDERAYKDVAPKGATTIFPGDDE